jgi:hypothetical protein
MWAEHVLSEPSLRRAAGNRDPARFSLDLRLNWSRSVPMSCVQEVAVKIDGNPVSEPSISLTQGGVELPLAAWRTRDDVWWPVLEPATLSASSAAPLAAGPHDIEVSLRVRVPGFAPDASGVWPTRFNRVTTVDVLR